MSYGMVELVSRKILFAVVIEESARDLGKPVLNNNFLGEGRLMLTRVLKGPPLACHLSAKVSVVKTMALTYERNGSISQKTLNPSNATDLTRNPHMSAHTQLVGHVLISYACVTKT